MRASTFLNRASLLACASVAAAGFGPAAMAQGIAATGEAAGSEAAIADAGYEPVSPRMGDLLALPLEDLLTLETTSVAKKRQRVSDSSAAVFVITQEDIAQSPASTIPELLRMAP